NRVGDSRQPGHLNTVGTAGAAGDYLPQENYPILPFSYFHVVIAHPILDQRYVHEFMVMRGKESSRPAIPPVVKIFGDRPRDGEPIKSTGSPADLVEKHERTLGCTVEDLSGFVHFYHEC